MCIMKRLIIWRRNSSGAGVDKANTITSRKWKEALKCFFLVNLKNINEFRFQTSATSASSHDKSKANLI